jgi:flagellar protein FliL
MSSPSVVRTAGSGGGGIKSAGGGKGEPTDDDGKKGKKGKKGGEGKKSKKKLIIIVVAVLVVVAVAYEFVLAPKKAAKPGPPVPGLVVPIDAVTLNLQGGHFLKIALGLQEIKKPKDATLDVSKAEDIMIAEFSNKTMAALATDAGRNAAKADLLKQLEKAYPGDLMDVYYTQFVAQ